MNTIDNLIENKIKSLEMNVARLQKSLYDLQIVNEELQRYMMQLVSNQTKLNEKVRNWPFVKVNSTDTDKKV